MQKNYKTRPVAAMVIVVCLLLSMMLTACQNGVSTSSDAENSPSAGNGNSSSSNTTSGGSAAGNNNSSSSNTTSGTHSPGATQKPTIPLITIRMLDGSHGWALTRQSVLKTVDGGAHWTQVEALHVGSIAPAADFMNVNYAWVTFQGATDPLGSYKVIRTSNGGVSWSIATITLTNDDQGQGIIDRPHFISATNGWVSIGKAEGMQHSSMTIFHTSNGGATWTQLATSFAPSSGLPMGANKTGISFANDNDGWATAEYPSSTPWLYVTHNGGTTWQSQSITQPAGLEPNTFTTTPPLLFGLDGIMPTQIYGDSSNIDLYVTHDGGATWMPTSTANYDVSTFSALDVQHVWAAQHNGTALYYTIDAGTSWHTIGNTPQPVSELSFVDAQNGWAIGQSTSTPQLYHTTNRGASWTQINYAIF